MSAKTATARSAFALCLLSIAFVGGCIPSGYVDGGLDTNMDVPQGPFVLFQGIYTVPFGEDVSYPQSVLVAVDSARTATGAYAWSDVAALAAAGTPLGALLAALDTEFGATTAPPSALVADAIADGMMASDPVAMSAAAARLDAALQVVLLLAFEHEVQAAVIEAADVSRLPPGIDDAGVGDAGSGNDVPPPCEDGGLLGVAFDGSPNSPDGAELSVNDAAMHWDFAALYLSGIEADIRRISTASGSGVFCAGACPITANDLLGPLADVLVRGQAAYVDAENAATSLADPSPYNRAITEAAASVRWGATKPFFLGALANVAAWTRAGGTLAESGVAQAYATGVLSVVAARSPDVDVGTAWRSNWGPTVTPALPAALQSFGPVFAGVANAAYAEYLTSLCTCGSEQDLDRWDALASSAATVDVISDALTFVGRDPAALAYALDQARIDTDASACIAPIAVLGSVPMEIDVVQMAGPP